MKKIFTFFLALVASAGTLFAASGTCGSNVTWDLTSGVLTISGTGDMTNWSDFTEVPWYSYSASIKSAVIEDGVTGIGLGAFFNCTNLSFVKLGNSVANIKNAAFFNCTGLTSITIPGSVTYLGYQTFGYCTGLTEITCYATTPPYCDSKCFEEVDKSIPVYVPSGKVTDYQKTTGWSDFTNIQASPSGTCGKEGDNLTWMLKGGVLTISGKGEMADYSTDDTPWNDYKSDIKSVVIESGATSIGKYAFYQCGNLTAVTIPDGVASIGNSAFYNCTGLTEVIIPNSVTVIGNGVFRGCTALTSVTLSEGLTTIALRTFQDCSKLTSIVIPAGVTTIIDRAFYKCTGLTSITCKATIPPTCGNSDCFYNVDKSIPVYVPEGTVEAYQKASVWSSFTNIKDPILASGTCGAEGDNLIWKLSVDGILTISGTGAMADWSSAGVVPWSAYASSITSIVIKEGATSIGKNAARNCKALTSVTIPNGVNTIGEYAFGYCPELSSITIPGSVTSIGEYAFRRCSALTSIVVENGNTIYDSRDNCNAIIETATNTLIQGCQNTLIPSGVTGIGKYAFEKCTGLKAMEMPNSVTSIGDYAFYDCSDLEALSMGDSVISIGKYAFAYCSAMTNIEFPNTVTNIGNYACQSCTGLTRIISLSTTPPECGSNCFDKVDKSIPVYVPEGTVEAYQKASVWSSFTNIQELDNILASGTCGAEGDNLIWKLSYDGVLTISGTGAMDDCIKENLVYLPWEDYVSSIKSVVIEEGVTSIGEFAFFGCTAITSITIPNSVSSVGGNAFYRCDGLTSPVYNSQIFAFMPTSYTGAYVIPDGIKTIAVGAFYECAGLTSVTIPSSVTSIGDYAFNGCDGLTSITCKALIPPTFGEGCFSNSNIPVYVPAQSVAAYLAEDCEWRFFDIQPIVELPASGTCGDNLTWTLSEDGLLTISGTGAMTEFFGESSDDRPWVYFLAYIKSVVIEEGVTSIGMGAFAYCKALTSVTIPSSVTGIGYGAFLNCSGLASITIAATTPPTCGEYCFDGVDKSIPVNVPAGCATVYSGWNGFTNIKAPENEKLKISDLAAKNITTTSATISWKGSGETYDLRYHVYNVYDFEEGLAPWTSYDTDGDGHEWEWHTSATFHTHNGSAGCAGSASYDTSTSSALTPNNWLVSPEVTLGGSMTFWATAQDPAYAAEHFQVYVSTDGATFAAVSNEYVCPTGRDYRLYTADLSKFSGKGYVAICHFNCTDMFWLNIDDIEIIEPGAMKEVDGLTATNYALSGLTAGTTYWVEVRSHYGTMVGEWTQLIFHTAANDEDAAAAKAVVDLIDAIGTPVTLASETAIVAARTAYDKLTDAQKELVSNYDVLVAAEEALADAKEAATWQGWTYYDNKDYDVSYGAYTDAVRWGILVPASSQTSTKLTKIALYEAEGTATEDITLTVYNGGDLPDEANSIYTETFSPEAADKFQIVTLANPVTIDPTKNVWIVMASKNSFPMSFTKTRYVENACWLYSNSTWYEISELVEGAWKIRALFEEEEEDMPVVPAGTVPYKLVDLSKESVTAGEYIIVFDDNKAHAAVSGKDLIASSDALTFEDDYAFVPEEAVCAVTIAPLGTDSFSILLADGTSYMDQTAKNSVTTSANPSAFAITDGGDQYAQISKTISDGKSYVLKHNGNYFRMYNGTVYTLPKLYRKKIVKYTITWKMDDGTVIDQTKVEAGVVPTHADPTKAATAEYTYTFAGWDPKVVAVTGDATYTATFTATKNSYTITWLNEDGSLIDKTTVEYGVVPTHADPTKAATAEYTYTFAGWNPKVVAVTGDATYTATFTATKNSYTVTWINWDGTVLDKETYVYGETPKYKGAEPTRPATAENTFTFTGWSPAITSVTGDATYKAQYSTTGQTYTITWKMDDGTVIAQETYAYGDMPNYADPTKAATAEFTYTFAGWNPKVVAVTGDATYTATFTATKNSYTITWLNEDGSLIDKTTVEYGVVPTHADPTKAATAEYTYTFAGWNPKVVAVTGDATYTATFTATKNSYTVTFVDWDGTELKKEAVEYGKAATAPADPTRAGYRFTGWDKAFDHIIADLTVTAQYEAIDYTPTNLKADLEPKESDLQITLSWDKVEGAASYELRLVAGEKELFSQNTMGLNVISSLLSVIEKTYSIAPGTYTMSWAVRSTDAMGKAISDWAAGPQFEITIKGSVTGVENVQSDNVPCTKVLRNGMIFILRDGKTYTVTGQEIK